MAGSLSWNNLSVKHKLFCLVFLPIVLLLFLAGQQVVRLSTQAQDLERAHLFSDYMDQVSYLYNLPSNPDVTDKAVMIKGTTEKLNATATLIFADKGVEMADLLSSLEEASLSLATSTDMDERLDLAEWRADTYKQILLALEKIPFNNATVEIQNHLSALMQIEWLMFWSKEENRLSQYLIYSVEQNQYYDTDIGSEIESLVKNQQLFLERFVTLNANQQQVELLIETFTNEVFVLSQEFRAYLFSEQELSTLPPQEVATGLTALNGRLELLQNVDNKMTDQLNADVDHAISIANQQRLMFIGVMSLITILVISLAIRLVRKVTGNLNLVLEFLRRDSYSEESPLAELVKGKDELSKFAQEVERLSYEREQAKVKLTQAKEDAERAKDDAIKASKAKSSFLANMSHEIRTPLNGVIGISEVLSDTSLTATQRDYVDTIETSSQLLLSLINDILDFSKIESGMLLISPHSTCVRESIYDIASIVSPKAKEKGIDLKVNISRNTPFRLMIDDHRLRQVIMNFMSNAVKFTESGTVCLSVSTHSVSGSYAVMEFSVQDSGIGIDEQQQKKIFEPFAQEDDSTTRQFGGTGLGLAISTQLVELMGGKIQLESEKGQGSRFFFQLTSSVVQLDFDSKHTAHNSQVWLVCDDPNMESTLRDELNFYRIAMHQSVTSLDELPTWINDKEQVVVIYAETRPNAAKANEDIFHRLETQNVRLCLVKHLHSGQFDFGQSVSAIITQPLLGQRLVKALESCEAKFTQKAQLAVTSVANTRAKILVVDDNTVNQKIAGLHVTKAGFPFDLAANGAEAVAMFKKSQYALILMDCMMPVMDGFEATEKIRQIEQDENRNYRIPIIALTASVVDDDIQKCFDVGMDDYVPKPFKANLLKEKLAKAANVPVVDATINNISPAPVSHVDNHQAAALKEEPSITILPSRSERILLVEDNTVNQKVASLLLSKAGYEFEIAENGQIAVDMFQQDNGFDIILMDCMMPVMDGFQATKEIRAYERNSGLPKTPIIALTASVVDDDIQRCYDSGMDAYVPKPVRKEKLLHQIESVI
ncbi:response regulator [Vibrio jasicida]|uniref:response regulator n=1 Tax=Vibrio jasicida TaxID=766224 RepID=UPI000CE5344B|nr:response regulator [Vibrio jasicida]